MSIAPAAPTAISAYIRDLRHAKTMTAAEERAAAHRLVQRRADRWATLLSYTPVVSGILALIEEHLGEKLDASAFRSAGEAACTLLEERRVKHQRRYDLAMRALAEGLAMSDQDQLVADMICADLEAIENGDVEHLNMRTAAPRRTEAFSRYLRRVRTANVAFWAARNEFVRKNLRLVFSMAQRYGRGRMPTEDLVQEGNLGLLKAVDRFDPTRGFRFSTFAAWWIRHAITRAVRNKARDVRLPVHAVDAVYKISEARRRIEVETGGTADDEALSARSGVPVAKIKRLERSILSAQPTPLDGGYDSDSGAGKGHTLIDTDQPLPSEELDNRLVARGLDDAIADLSEMEQDVLRRRFGLDGGEAMTLREVGVEHNLSRERIRQIQERALTRIRHRLDVHNLRGVGGLLIALLFAVTLMGCWSHEAAWETVDDPARATTRRGGETKTEGLHRHGVNCMDVIERDDCAIDYFEQLVKLEPDRDREIVADSMFRLVALYRRNDQPDAATLLLRKYWDSGGQRDDAGKLPYSARFLSADFSALARLEMDRLSTSPLYAALSDDAKDLLFSCDDARRDEVKETVRVRTQAEREARLASMTPAQRERSAARRERFKGQSEGFAQRARPIDSVMTCAVLQALELDDRRDLSRVLTAYDHRDPRRSAAVIEVPSLPERLARAEASGALTSISDGEWRLAGQTYEGAEVRLAHLDHNELVIAPPEEMTQVIAAYADGRRTRFAGELDEIIETVPRDSVFFSAFSAAATSDALAGAGQYRALMPEPRGLMIAGVAHEYAGLFVRMPTNDPMKSYMMLSVVRQVLGSARAETPEETVLAKMLGELDVAQSPDGEALLMSAVIHKSSVDHLFTSGA